MDRNYDIPETLRGYIIPHRKVQLGKYFAQGAYGIVAEAKWESSSVAVKRIQPSLYQQANEQELKTQLDKFLKECEKMCIFRHPNIVQFFGICFFDDGSPMPGLIME